MGHTLIQGNLIRLHTAFGEHSGIADSRMNSDCEDVWLLSSEIFHRLDLSNLGRVITGHAGAHGDGESSRLTCQCQYSRTCLIDTGQERLDSKK